VAAAPHMFWQGAVIYNLTLPPRPDSLSLFTAAAPGGPFASFAIVPIGTLLVLAIALWKLRGRHPGSCSARPGRCRVQSAQQAIVLQRVVIRGRLIVLGWRR